MKYKFLSLLGLIFNLSVFFIFQVKADDGGGEGGLEGLAPAMGILGFVLFGFSVGAGFIIFLNRFKGIREAFQRNHFPLKYIYKSHHYISSATLVILVIHLLIVWNAGYGLSGGFTCFMAYIGLGVLGLIALTGLLFRKVQGIPKDILRGIHLTLMVIIAVFLGTHVMTFES
jgi:hypothetical protein